MDARSKHRVVHGLFLAILAGILSGCTVDDGPIATLVAESVTGPAPFDATFDLSYSVAPSGQAMAYALDFGDGAAVTGSDFDVIVHHTYDGGGVYEALFLVTDDAGRQASDHVTITVDEDGPAVGTEVGDTAPDFTAHTTDGGSITLSDYRGSVVVLDFWGAWCTPCRVSLPHLDTLAQTYADQGLVGVMVSTDPLEQTSIDYLAGGGYDAFISVWEPGGKSGSPITELYGVSSSDIGIPRTYVIDRQGVIRYVGHPADLSGEMLEAVL